MESPVLSRSLPQVIQRQQGLVCLHVCRNTWAAPKVGQAVSCPPISAVPYTLLIYVRIHGPENGFALIQPPSFEWSPWWLLNQSWKGIVLGYGHRLSSCNNTRLLPRCLWVRSLGLTESSEAHGLQSRCRQGMGFPPEAQLGKDLLPRLCGCGPDSVPDGLARLNASVFLPVVSWR